jgi:hypothetical protein
MLSAYLDCHRLYYGLQYLYQLIQKWFLCYKVNYFNWLYKNGGLAGLGVGNLKLCNCGVNYLEIVKKIT